MSELLLGYQCVLTHAAPQESSNFWASPVVNPCSGSSWVQPGDSSQPTHRIYAEIIVLYWLFMTEVPTLQHCTRVTWEQGWGLSREGCSKHQNKLVTLETANVRGFSSWHTTALVGIAEGCELGHGPVVRHTGLWVRSSGALSSAPKWFTLSQSPCLLKTIANNPLLCVGDQAPCDWTELSKSGTPREKGINPHSYWNFMLRFKMLRIKCCTHTKHSNASVNTKACWWSIALCKRQRSKQRFLSGILSPLGQSFCSQAPRGTQEVGNFLHKGWEKP